MLLCIARNKSLVADALAEDNLMLKINYTEAWISGYSAVWTNTEEDSVSLVWHVSFYDVSYDVCTLKKKIFGDTRLFMCLSNAWIPHLLGQSIQSSALLQDPCFYSEQKHQTTVCSNSVTL